jgi:acyl carrier protein
MGALKRRAAHFTRRVTDRTPLTEAGLCLDSVSLMDFIAEIETVFGTSVKDEDIAPEHFGTVGRVVRFLEGRVADTRTRQGAVEGPASRRPSPETRPGVGGGKNTAGHRADTRPRTPGRRP